MKFTPGLFAVVAFGTASLVTFLVAFVMALRRRRPPAILLTALAFVLACLTTWFGTFTPLLHSIAAASTLACAAGCSTLLRGRVQRISLAAGIAWLATMLAARAVFPPHGPF